MDLWLTFLDLLLDVILPSLLQEPHGAARYYSVWSRRGRREKLELNPSGLGRGGGHWQEGFLSVFPFSGHQRENMEENCERAIGLLGSVSSLTEANKIGPTSPVTIVILHSFQKKTSQFCLDTELYRHVLTIDSSISIKIKKILETEGQYFFRIKWYCPKKEWNAINCWKWKFILKKWRRKNRFPYKPHVPNFVP
jgi:hypothetical protein